MKMYNLPPGNLSAIGWEFDPKLKHGVLRVKFNRGQTYEYYPVPKEMFDDFWKAESKGKWFHAKIKTNKSINFEKYEPNDK